MTVIPVIGVSSDISNDLFTGHLTFDGRMPSLERLSDYATKVKETVSSFDEKQPVVIIDVKGLQKRNINPTLLKKLKIHGASAWYMTDIECVEDVFDAFNTDAEKVLMPCHTVSSEQEMDDILNVSDSVIPVVFVERGYAPCFGQNYLPADLTEILFDKGFRSVIVLDLQNSISHEEWKLMSSQGHILPFVMGGDPPEGYEYVLKAIL